MSSDLASFGAVLRQLRADAALSQEELAERAGLSVRGISDLERGTRKAPHLHTVRLLADALGLSDGDRTTLLTAARPPRGDGHYEAEAMPPLVPMPYPLTPLIGRATEVAALRTLLRQDDVRLVTLTGAGGMGKTRLALAIGEQMAPDFPDGVVFVSLAPLGVPALVASAIAQRLNVREAAQQPLAERLKGWFGDKRLLLILDNFEHLLPAAPLIAELLAACRCLKTLVTSRAPLHLSGEYVYPAPPLALPDSGRISPLAELGQTEAVRLFVDRGRATKPDFALTAANAPAVAEIVRRLDGLPLAIELAAGRIRTLSPAALLARLDRRLPLLTGGAQDLPIRQRTLRDTIAWSYDLLPQDEQTLFRHLAIFAGSWSLEAATAIVAAAAEAACAPLDVLEGVSSLVDKSLLHGAEEFADEPRFAMLQTVREYGLELLVESGELTSVGEAHAAYYLALAGGAEPYFLGAGEEVWLDRLETEFDNIRTAVARAIARDDAETQLRFASRLWRFLRVRGHMSEGRQWLEHALATPTMIPAVARREALFVAGLLAYHQNDYERSIALLRELLALSREADDASRAGLALAILGVALLDLGRYDEAIPHFEDAAPLLQKAENIPWLIVVRGALGHAVYQLGDRRRAVALAEEAIALQPARAGPQTAIPIELLAEVARDAEDYPRAVAFYRQSMALWQTPGDTWHLADCFTALADIAAICRRPDLGARLLGMAEHLREVLGASLRPRLRAIHERAIAAAQEALDDKAFAAEWAAGRSLDVDDAVAIAAQVREAAERSRRGAVPLPPAGLTPRELEVLKLVAEGRPDREIAEALFVSRRTVTSHMSSILGKLGVTSRSAAVAFAVRHDLD